MWGWFAEALRGSRHDPDGHGFSFCGARGALVFLAREARKNTRLDLRLLFSAGRDGSALIPKAMGYNVRRAKRVFFRRAKRGGICLAREARRNARLDVRLFRRAKRADIFRRAMRAVWFFGARSAPKRSTRCTCFLGGSRRLFVYPDGPGLAMFSARRPRRLFHARRRILQLTTASTNIQS